MQFVENLSDRQAADAVRGHLAWKYALSLELDHPGFDASVLTEFRQRLLAQDNPLLMLDRLLARCQELGVLRPHGKLRTDSTHVMAAIRVMNRLELIVETGLTPKLGHSRVETRFKYERTLSSSLFHPVVGMTAACAVSCPHMGTAGRPPASLAHSSGVR